MAKKRKESFIIYYEWEEYFKDLPLDVLGEIFLAMFDYEVRGKRYSGDNVTVRMAMNFVQGTFDRNKIKYEERCERNRRNIEKRWGTDTKNTTGKSGKNFDTKNTDHEHEHEHEHDPDHDPDHEHEHEHDPDHDPDHEHDPEHDPDYDSAAPDWRTAPPSFEDVDCYAATRAYCVDVQEFFDYYAERNWKTQKGLPVNWPQKLKEWNERAVCPPYQGGYP